MDQAARQPNPRTAVTKVMKPSKASVPLMPPEFSARLRERVHGSLTLSDIRQTLGEFVVLKANGKVDEDHPHTRIVKEVLEFLNA